MGWGEGGRLQIFHLGMQNVQGFPWILGAQMNTGCIVVQISCCILMEGLVQV